MTCFLRDNVWLTPSRGSTIWERNLNLKCLCHTQSYPVHYVSTTPHRNEYSIKEQFNMYSKPYGIFSEHFGAISDPQTQISTEIDGFRSRELFRFIFLTSQSLANLHTYTRCLLERIPEILEGKECDLNSRKISFNYYVQIQFRGTP